MMIYDDLIKENNQFKKILELDFDTTELLQLSIEYFEYSLDASWFLDTQFTNQQKKTIYYGLREGVDVSWYAHPKIPHKKMEKIKDLLSLGVDISIFLSNKISYHILDVIYVIYCNDKFEKKTQDTIINYILKNIFIHKKKYNIKQTKIMSKYLGRTGFAKVFDTEKHLCCLNPDFNYKQMEIIFKAIYNNIDISKFADLKYSAEQMNVLYEMISNKFDEYIHLISDPKMHHEYMYAIFKIRRYFSKEISDNILNRGLNIDQLYVLSLGIYVSHNIHLPSNDLLAIADPRFNLEQLVVLMHALNKNQNNYLLTVENIKEFIDPNIPAEKMKEGIEQKFNIKLKEEFTLDKVFYFKKKINKII